MKILYDLRKNILIFTVSLSENCGKNYSEHLRSKRKKYGLKRKTLNNRNSIIAKKDKKHPL